MALALLAASFSRGEGLLRTLALSGDATPHGVGVFHDFSSPLLTNAGHVVYRATVDVEAAHNLYGLFRVDSDGQASTIAVSGEPTPNGDGFFYSFNEYAVAPSGRVAFTHFSNDEAYPRGEIWKETASSMMEPIAIAGNGWLAPGTDSEFAHLATELRINARGQLFFSTSLISDGPYWGSGLWGESASGQLSLIARDGMPAPGADADFGELSYASWGATATSDGRIAFGAIAGDPLIGTDSVGIWVYDPKEGLRHVVQEGDPALGGAVRFDSVLSPAMNQRGGVAFLAITDDTGQGALEIGIFRDLNDGLGPQAVVRSGDIVLDPGVTFASANQLLKNSQGELLFAADIEGNGVTSDNDIALFLENGDGTIQLIAREGDSIPETDLEFYRRSSNGPYFFASLNARGQTAFAAWISGPGVSENNTGLFAYDGDELRLVAYEGGLLDVSDDPALPDLRTIADLDFRSGSGNDDGRGSAFNDRGQIAFAATFTDGTSGVFVSDLIATPLPTAGDYNGDGLVTAADLNKWNGSYGALVVPFSGADGNGDGLVDAADYTVWRDAMQSDRQAVPEPGALGLAALAALGMAKRIRARRGAADRLSGTC